MRWLGLIHECLYFFNYIVRPTHGESYIGLSLDVNFFTADECVKFFYILRTRDEATRVTGCGPQVFQNSH